MSDDAHKGGDLFDMAKDGTTIPGDAGVMNLVPSVPRPDQDSTTVDNATDIPRTTADPGATGEVVTGTGNVLPAAVEKKRLDADAGTPAAKGHPRDAHHSQSTPAEASKGPQVEAAPGEEDVPQDRLRTRRESIVDSGENVQRMRRESNY